MQLTCSFSALSVLATDASFSSPFGSDTGGVALDGALRRTGVDTAGLRAVPVAVRTEEVLAGVGEAEGFFDVAANGLDDAVDMAGNAARSEKEVVSQEWMEMPCQRKE